ncbi:class A beta-lactamase-related serine hydrolase, partial [Patescibacteria group bacterium]|nr:class A beta-lactamase-related serine hydrolase [Patescibacteria group bacterium]
PINHISVYFRDLNNGPWFGINEKENFAPASLLKTPLMITYYKKEEANPGYLNNKLEFTPEIASIYGSNPETALLTIGQSYTIDELINNMIIESDNNSFDTLIQNIDFNEIKQVHIDLGLTVPDQQTPDDFITVKEYASLFRVLFNASYLNRAMSEKALSLLSQATFDQGIAAGLPQGTTIANKFGIKTIAENQEKQLHDCGIIYYPNHPYLLCIMTRGNDLNELTRTIREISSAVYQQIDSQYNN